MKKILFLSLLITGCTTAREQALLDILDCTNQSVIAVNAQSPNTVVTKDIIKKDALNAGINLPLCVEQELSKHPDFLTK